MHDTDFHRRSFNTPPDQLLEIEFIIYNKDLGSHYSALDLLHQTSDLVLEFRKVNRLGQESRCPGIKRL
jgi:hypothetical protein